MCSSLCILDLIFNVYTFGDIKQVINVNNFINYYGSIKLFFYELKLQGFFILFSFF